MPVGDTQQAFANAALRDGIELVRQSFPWACEQGHFGLLRVAETSCDEDLILREGRGRGTRADLRDARW
jgi:hypothetical protein